MGDAQDQTEAVEEELRKHEDQGNANDLRSSTAEQQREESRRKIDSLGSLPSTELETHAHMALSGLIKELQKTQRALGKFSHVNKKALDQYVSFSEQREVLLQRKQELDEGERSIQDLMDTLDRQKDESIMQTFQEAAKHFSQVFSELVPTGWGQLLLQTSSSHDGHGAAEDLSASGSSEAAPTSQTFKGVEVKVSFTAGGEVFLMSQLSGGQKAIVALSIIFAIQRVDPAPFYLFDELDQALDSTYRAAVASMISRQSGQFITTTFRPELVRVADRCYGVSLQSKNSRVHSLDRAEALSFVADLIQEEETMEHSGSAGAASGPRSRRRPAAAQQQAAEVTDEEDDDDDDNEEEDEDEEEEEEQPRAHGGGLSKKTKMKLPAVPILDSLGQAQAPRPQGSRKRRR